MALIAFYLIAAVTLVSALGEEVQDGGDSGAAVSGSSGPPRGRRTRWAR